MTRESLKAFALCNIDEFDDFFTLYEDDIIKKFTKYICKKRVYHICVMDFASLLFYKVYVLQLKMSEIRIDALAFDDIIEATA